MENDEEKFVFPEWRVLTHAEVFARLDEHDAKSIQADARRKLIAAASGYGEHDHGHGE